MSTVLKRLVICALGVLSGVAAWPVMEFLLINQGIFERYLVFSVLQGSILGLMLGIIFGSFEGIALSDSRKMVSGSIMGAFIGILGGTIGFLIGQNILFWLGQEVFTTFKDFNTLGLPLARAVGWMIMGVFIGASEGFRARSMKKITLGIFGGLLGGLFGGLILEFSNVLFPEIIYARLIGLMVFGLCIGLFYSLIEKQFSHGSLRILNGISKGKEYLINQNRMRLGREGNNEIILADYDGVGLLHAQIKVRGKDVILEAMDSSYPVFVDEEPVEQKVLKYDDVLKVGSAKLYYVSGR